MSGDIACGIVIGSSFFGSILLRELSKLIFNKSMAKMKILRLENKLKQNLYDLKYSSFKDTIYEITVLDSKYETSYLNKIKKKYFINDTVMNDINVFKMKYDRNHVYTNYIQEEVERSISRIM